MKEMIDRIGRMVELYLRFERIFRGLDAGLSAKGLQMAYVDFRALGCVLTLGPISLKQAADTLMLPKTSTHYIMHKLEVAGYIERSLSRKRSMPVFLITPAGKDAWGEAVQALVEGPLGRVLIGASDAQMESHLQAVRELSSDPGTKGEGEKIAAEAAILAVSIVEILLSSDMTGVTSPHGDCLATLPENLSQG